MINKSWTNTTKSLEFNVDITNKVMVRLQDLMVASLQDFKFTYNSLLSYWLSFINDAMDNITCWMICKDYIKYHLNFRDGKAR